DSTQPDNAALFKAIGFAWGGDGDSTCRICRDFFYAAWIQTVPNHREIAVCLFRPIKIAISGFRSVFGGDDGNKVGSDRRCPAAIPFSKFKMTSAGNHVHAMNFEITATRDVNGQNNTVANPSRLSDSNQ